MLEADKLHRDSFTKSMATYYEQVRVCPMCHKIYMVLDWAREVLDQQHTLPPAQDSNKSTALSRTQSRTAAAPSVRSSKSEPHLRATKGTKAHSVTSALSAEPSLKDLANPTGAESSLGSLPPGEKTLRSESRDRGGGSGGGGAGKSSWKNYRQKGIRDETFEKEKFADLDDYLRGGTEVLAERKKKEKDALVRKRINQLQRESLEESALLRGSRVTPENMYRGKVLLACSEGQTLVDTKFILEEAFFDVRWVPDGLQALNDLYKDGSKKDSEFDCLIIERGCSLHDAFQVVAKVREQEKLIRRTAAAKEAAKGRGVQPFTRRLPVICFTADTAPADLQAYMKADMDGCVSMPPNKTSLINTVRAAIPHHLAAITGPSLEELNRPQEPFPKSFKQGILGTLEGSTDSATTAAKQLVVAAGSSADSDSTVSGIVQIDADTRVPYMVMDFARSSKLQLSSQQPYFNLVVCHDLFDTAEKLKIFFKPIAQKYLGMQILFWNYPGQAFTEWRPEQLLNNEYHATCLNEVMGQVGEKGTKDFDTSRPFYMLGYGHGASVLSFYASHYNIPNLRGLISINGWSFLDSYLAGAMHDCINVFQAAPASRPDLPVYFFSRFLFSKDYLAKVSVPLALNLYTAVHNPISLAGRLSLCKGVVHSVDVRSVLKEIDCPVICIQSTQDAFARPLHTEPFVTNRGGEVRSIFKALIDPQKTCVIWMKAGHEIFQECRKQTQTLLEQILTGFHESNDISFPPAPVVDKTAQSSSVVSSRAGERDRKYHMSVEDKFIDTVLDNIKTVDGDRVGDGRDSHSSSRNVRHFRPGSTGGGNSPPEEFTQSWEDYAVNLAESQVLTGSKRSKGKGTVKGKLDSLEQSSFLTFDASSSLFEKQDSQFYNPKDSLAKTSATASGAARVADFPEVKEYMGWRLKRNKKRLQRLQAAARTIQGAFRAHIARQLVRGIRRRKAAMTIQRCFRGWLGRCSFLNQARRIWATLTIQRAWRGYLGRKWYYHMRLQIAGAATIQRYWRGYVAREYVKEIHHQRYLAACRIQSIFRRNQARRDAWKRREQRNAATAVQRMYRGHLGRRRAAAERDKYIFSKSQTQGIEFGRQMLLEHKLHATKLQSDVTLLTQEKVAAEEQVEALLEEITSFEEGVRILEKEMHQLAKVEVEAAAYMDEESKYELREQKMRLDREFGDMLNKIGSRKDMLSDLEVKLSTIDKSRQMKEEELRTLERKLVVLLEEQQNELRAIKRKQDVRGALLAASHDQLMKASSNSAASGQLQITNGSVGGDSGSMNQVSVGGGGGFTGPSMKEKQQVAQLMQSTETLMKFGFMSMSMTYFSSINMVKAMRTVSAQDTVMAALADSQAQRAAVAIPPSTSGVPVGNGAVGTTGQFLPSLKKGQLPGQEALNVSSWSVEDVSRWLQTMSLGQYSEAFIDAAVDGEFLYDLNDDDLKNTLGVEHRLHRKKILNCVHRLKIAEASRDARVGHMLREMGNDQPQVCHSVPRHLPFPPSHPPSLSLAFRWSLDQSQRHSFPRCSIPRTTVSLLAAEQTATAA
jgi:CheY-like chemotaxis protein/pimeloyl-ACP methyl ester carboxylesterase